MIKHFNTYDVYKYTKFNVYSPEKMLALDYLLSACRSQVIDFLIKCNSTKHTSDKNVIFKINMKLRDLWPSMCTDFAREFIDKLDSLWSETNTEDYIWFLKKEENEEDIWVSILVWGNTQTVEKLHFVDETLQDILDTQDFLTFFDISFPASTELRDNDDAILLDCGFALKFDMPENTNN